MQNYFTDPAKVKKKFFFSRCPPFSNYSNLKYYLYLAFGPYLKSLHAKIWLEIRLWKNWLFFENLYILAFIKKPSTAIDIGGNSS